MGVPLVGLLKHFNQSWCNDKLKSYGTTGHGGMTMGALVFSVVLMMILGFILLCSGFVRLFLGRQTLNLSLGGYSLYPALGVLLRVTFVLFLPLLSTVFSLTKQQGGGNGSTTGLLLVLLWMLLIELIRKKVMVMVLPRDGSSFSRAIGRFTLIDYADEVAHVLWTGYLVYSNIQDAASPLTKAMFAALWSLSVLKLVQRAANTYVAACSLHTARNPLLIAVYMQHVVDDEMRKNQEEEQISSSSDPATISSDVMRTCRFVVSKEKRLVVKKKKKNVERKLVTAPSSNSNPPRSSPMYDGDGANHSSEEKLVGLDIDDNKIRELVTVGNIWEWGHGTNLNAKELFSHPERQAELENWCLSFSLFKMLRRRFEKYPMAEAGSSMARRLMLQGLLNLPDKYDRSTSAGTRTSTSNAHTHRPFQVLQLELDFLENYYQAAQNVVMSQPYLFFINFAMSMLFVPIYLVTVLAILFSNEEDAAFLYCAAMGWSGGHSNSSLIIYLSITLALLGTLVCIEASEFFTSFFFSNWNTVRLVCEYGSKPQRWLIRKILYWFISFRFSVSDVLRFFAKHFLRQKPDAYTKIKINQVSIVNACGPLDKVFTAWTSQVTLEPEAKKDIIEALQKQGAGTISHPAEDGSMIGQVLKGTSVTEIILATHLATELFHIEQTNKGEKLKADNSPGKVRLVATTLSRYCMYLVAHLPALLPDDETWVSDKFDDMRKCLSKVMKQCGGCTMCTPSRSCKHKIEESLRENKRFAPEHLRKTLEDALELRNNNNISWEKLANFWVNLLVYLAPSDNIEGHAKAVATSGGDLITYLWTFCTHAGITRQPTTSDHDV